MIIVSGLHRKNGQVRTQTYRPGNEGPARTYQSHLRALGYQTVLVNDVKNAFQQSYDAGVRFLAAEREAKGFTTQREEPFAFEGIAGYQLHSLGTRSGCMKGKHIDGASTLAGAIDDAEDRVNGWSDRHKGIVIYKAIKLVRRITKPTTEIVELS